MPDEQIGQELEQDVQTEVTTVETPAELPEDANERTKREFEKLKEHNRQLAEELERAKTRPSESALGSLNPQTSAAIAPNLNKEQVDDIVKGLVDENGYLDQALLENTLKRANQEVAEAKALAQKASQEALQARQAVSKFEETREVRIAHKKFPAVDPESKKYDPHFYKLVKNELLGAMYEGKKVSFVEACREVSQIYQPKTSLEDTKAKAVDEYKKDVALKSGLNQTGKSRPDTHVSQNDLVEGTRKGDAQSIFERLKSINS